VLMLTVYGHRGGTDPTGIWQKRGVGKDSRARHGVAVKAHSEDRARTDCAGAISRSSWMPRWNRGKSWRAETGIRRRGWRSSPGRLATI